MNGSGLRVRSITARVSAVTRTDNSLAAASVFWVTNGRTSRSPRSKQRSLSTTRSPPSVSGRLSNSLTSASSHPASGRTPFRARSPRRTLAASSNRASATPAIRPNGVARVAMRSTYLVADSAARRSFPSSTGRPSCTASSVCASDGLDTAIASLTTGSAVIERR